MGDGFSFHPPYSIVFLSLLSSLSLFDYSRSTDRLHKVNLKCLLSDLLKETLPTTMTREREKPRLPLVPSLGVLEEIMWVVLDQSKSPVCIFNLVVNRKQRLIRVRSADLWLAGKVTLRVMPRGML